VFLRALLSSKNLNRAVTVLAHPPSEVEKKTPRMAKRDRSTTNSSFITKHRVDQHLQVDMEVGKQH
jgi:hypothetical protein